VADFSKSNRARFLRDVADRYLLERAAALIECSLTARLTGRRLRRSG
jgi:hypothetical protein